jgi:hypothetical protein
MPHFRKERLALSAVRTSPCPFTLYCAGRHPAFTPKPGTDDGGTYWVAVGEHPIWSADGNRVVMDDKER